MWRSLWRGKAMAQEPRFSIRQATDSDGGRLAELRVAAMRPSLEAVGRFDPDRARRRFLDSFRPEDTMMIRVGDALAGFFVLRRHPDHLYLDHLYIAADWQGRGIGRRIVEDIKATARAASLPVRLVALNGSPANAFYRAAGFDVTGTDALDTCWQWMP